MGGYGKRKRGYCWWWWPPQSASLYISLCLWLWWWSLITQNIIWDQKFVLCLLLFRCLCLCLCLVCDCDDDDCSNPHSGTMCFPGKIPISMGIRANNIFGLISKIFQFMSKFIFFCKMNLVKTYSVQNTLQAKYYIEEVQLFKLSFCFISPMCFSIFRCMIVWWHIKVHILFFINTFVSKIR